VFAGQDGVTGTSFLGRQVYLSQLNAAVRRVARQLQLPLLDYELMSSALGYGAPPAPAPQTMMMMGASSCAGGLNAAPRWWRGVLPPAGWADRAQASAIDGGWS
jgi:hypothetical protein